MDPHAQLEVSEETAGWSHADGGMLLSLDAAMADAWASDDDDDRVDVLDAQILAGLVSP